MHIYTKSIIGILGAMGIRAITQASSVITVPTDIENMISNYTTKTDSIHFQRGGNDFQGAIIWDTPQLLNDPEIIQFGNETITCNQRITGLYYNNQRGGRRRPLDQTTHNMLQAQDNSYDNIALSGGLFTDCGSNNPDAVYGQITHILTGSLSGEYKLLAGVEYNFNTNSYNTNSDTTLTQSDHDGDGYIYDSAGGIGEIYDNIDRVQFEYHDNDTDPGDEPTTNSNNNGISNGSSSQEPIIIPEVKGESITKLCDYDDVPYEENGPFTDTAGHRGFPYIEILRISCLNQGRGRAKGERFYEPNANITRAEVLKTVAKILGSTNEDFTVEDEQKIFTGNRPFLDTPNWFNHYADFAFKQGLTEGLYITDSNGNKYLRPDESITRQEAIKIIILAYNQIQQSMIDISGSSVLGDVVDKQNPYYSYIRQAEEHGFIAGIKEDNNKYYFRGERNLSRAEFAKIVGVPFSEQLFDIKQLVQQSDLLQSTIEALNSTKSDKKVFIQTLFEKISQIDEMTFIQEFKVPKESFLEVLYDTVVKPILEEEQNEN